MNLYKCLIFKMLNLRDSTLKHAHREFKPRMDRLPILKQTIRLRGTSLEISKACID